MFFGATPFASVSFAADGTVPIRVTVTGVEGVGAIGNVTVAIPSTAVITGLVMYGYIGTVSFPLWSIIGDNTSGAWSSVPTVQTAAWQLIPTPQTANWVDI